MTRHLAHWRAGTAASVPATPVAAEASNLKSWLIDRLASELKVPSSEIDPAEPFARYGLDSAAAVGISCEIASAFKVDVDATLLWDYPSVDELSAYLGRQKP